MPFSVIIKALKTIVEVTKLKLLLDFKIPRWSRNEKLQSLNPAENQHTQRLLTLTRTFLNTQSSPFDYRQIDSIRQSIKSAAHETTSRCISEVYLSKKFDVLNIRLSTLGNLSREVVELRFTLRSRGACTSCDGAGEEGNFFSRLVLKLLFSD